MRIALLTYRGNMFCGGQGVYAAALARGLHELGHDVHVISGPPLPELAPGIPLHVIPNEMFFALPMAQAPPASPRAGRHAVRASFCLWSRRFGAQSSGTTS